MKQFTLLSAKIAFQVRSLNSRGRPVNVKPGDLFLVTSPKHNNTDRMMLDRKSKATINSGYCFSRTDVENLFDAVE